MGAVSIKYTGKRFYGWTRQTSLEDKFLKKTGKGGHNVLQQLFSNFTNTSAKISFEVAGDVLKIKLFNVSPTKDIQKILKGCDTGPWNLAFEKQGNNEVSINFLNPKNDSSSAFPARYVFPIKPQIKITKTKSLSEITLDNFLKEITLKLKSGAKNKETVKFLKNVDVKEYFPLFNQSLKPSHFAVLELLSKYENTQVKEFLNIFKIDYLTKILVGPVLDKEGMPALDSDKDKYDNRINAFYILDFLKRNGNKEAEKAINEFKPSKALFSDFINGVKQANLVMREMYNRNPTKAKNYLSSFEPKVLLDKALEGSENALEALILVAKSENKYLLTNKVNSKTQKKYRGKFLIRNFLKKLSDFHAGGNPKNTNEHSQSYYSKLAVLIGEFHNFSVQSENRKDYMEQYILDKEVTSERTNYLLMSLGGKDIFLHTFGEWKDKRFSGEFSDDKLASYLNALDPLKKRQVDFLLTFCQFNLVDIFKKPEQVVDILVAALKNKKSIARVSAIIVNLLNSYQKNFKVNLLHSSQLNKLSEFLLEKHNFYVENPPTDPVENVYFGSIQYLIKAYFDNVEARCHVAAVNKLSKLAKDIRSIPIKKTALDTLFYNRKSKSFEYNSVLFFHKDESWFKWSGGFFQAEEQAILVDGKLKKFEVDHEFMKEHKLNAEDYIVVKVEQKIFMKDVLMPHMFLQIKGLHPDDYNVDEHHNQTNKHYGKKIFKAFYKAGYLDNNGNMSDKLKRDIAMNRLSLDLTSIDLDIKKYRKSIINLVKEYIKGKEEIRVNRIILSQDEISNRAETLTNITIQNISHRAHSFHIKQTYPDLISYFSEKEGRDFDLESLFESLDDKIITALSCGSFRDAVSNPLNINYQYNFTFADYNTGEGANNNRLLYHLTNGMAFGKKNNPVWNDFFKGEVKIASLKNISTTEIDKYRKDENAKKLINKEFVSSLIRDLSDKKLVYMKEGKLFLNVKNERAILDNATAKANFVESILYTDTMEKFFKNFNLDLLLDLKKIAIEKAKPKSQQKLSNPNHLYIAKHFIKKRISAIFELALSREAFDHSGFVSPDHLSFAFVGFLHLSLGINNQDLKAFKEASNVD